MSCCQFIGITKVLCILSGAHASKNEFICLQSTTNETGTSNINGYFEKWAKRNEFAYYHFNTRTQAVCLPVKYLLGLDQGVISKPAYNQDVDPRDYILFRHLHNFCSRKLFGDCNDQKIHSVQFFTENYQNLYKLMVITFQNRSKMINI